ncbi:hypothetical protein MTO96_050288 [Rhipicephalus appendiculatus]
MLLIVPLRMQILGGTMIPHAVFVFVAFAVLSFSAAEGLPSFFEVVSNADEDEVTLRAVELHPVWMEDIVPYVEGLGSFGAQAGVAFAKLFPQVLRDLWVNILPTFVARTMQDTVRRM